MERRARPRAKARGHALIYQDPHEEEVREVDPRYFRPAEVELLLGEPSKNKRERYVQEGGLVATPLRGRRCSAKQPGYSVKNYYE